MEEIMSEPGSEAEHYERADEWARLQRCFYRVPLPGDSDPVDDPPMGGEDEPFGQPVRVVRPKPFTLSDAGLILYGRDTEKRK